VDKWAKYHKGISRATAPLPVQLNAGRRHVGEWQQTVGQEFAGSWQWAMM
jgi:hypothetical protein